MPPTRSSLREKIFARSDGVLARFRRYQAEGKSLLTGPGWVVSAVDERIIARHRRFGNKKPPGGPAVVRPNSGSDGKIYEK